MDILPGKRGVGVGGLEWFLKLPRDLVKLPGLVIALSGVIRPLEWVNNF